MIAALANVALVPTQKGGLRAPLETPSRSLLLYIDGGPGLEAGVIGVLISTPGAMPLVPGDEIDDVRLDFWDELADLYISGPSQEFHLGYPSRIVARGRITSVFPAEG